MQWDGVLEDLGCAVGGAPSACIEGVAFAVSASAGSVPALRVCAGRLCMGVPDFSCVCKGRGAPAVCPRRWGARLPQQRAAARGAAAVCAQAGLCGERGPG